MNHSVRSGITAASLVALLWGTEPLVLKLARQTLPTITLAQFRLFGAGIFLLLFALWPRRPDKSNPLRTEPFLVAVSGGLLLLNNLGFVHGLSFLEPFTAVLLLQLGPLLYAVCGQLLWGDPITGRQQLGTAAAVVGFGLFFIGLFHRTGLASLEGLAAVVLGAVAWCGYAVALRQLTVRHTPSIASASVLAAACVLSLPFTAPGILSTARSDTLLLGAVAVLNGGAVLFLAAALKRCPPSLLGPIVALNPLLTALLTAALPLGASDGGLLQQLSIVELTAAALALFGIVLSCSAAAADHPPGNATAVDSATH